MASSFLKLNSFLFVCLFLSQALAAPVGLNKGSYELGSEPIPLTRIDVEILKGTLKSTEVRRNDLVIQGYHCVHPLPFQFRCAKLSTENLSFEAEVIPQLRSSALIKNLEVLSDVVDARQIRKGDSFEEWELLQKTRVNGAERSFYRVLIYQDFEKFIFQAAEDGEGEIELIREASGQLETFSESILRRSTGWTNYTALIPIL